MAEVIIMPKLGFNMDEGQLVKWHKVEGETVQKDGEKGWTLACFHGYPLGWAKETGGTLKNHYPKGLRIQG